MAVLTVQFTAMVVTGVDNNYILQYFMYMHTLVTPWSLAAH